MTFLWNEKIANPASNTTYSEVTNFRGGNI